MENLAEEIKKLKIRGRESPPSLEKMAKILAAVFDQAANNEAFRLFQDKQFRHFVDFDKLPQVEQDRVFNELVLANLVLLMLILEAPDLRVENIMKDYLLSVKDKIPEAHLQNLKELGIESKYLQDWRKLIKMRHEEYSQDKLELRQAAMEIEAKENKLTMDKLDDIQLFLPVQTVAIGCHHHICRGKTEGKDELFKLILRWLSKFYVEIRVPIEGGKITFWGRLRAKIRHLIHKLQLVG